MRHWLYLTASPFFRRIPQVILIDNFSISRAKMPGVVRENLDRPSKISIVLEKSRPSEQNLDRPSKISTVREKSRPLLSKMAFHSFAALYISALLPSVRIFPLRECSHLCFEKNIYFLIFLAQIWLVHSDYRKLHCDYRKLHCDYRFLQLFGLTALKPTNHSWAIPVRLVLMSPFWHGWRPRPRYESKITHSSG